MSTPAELRRAQADLARLAANDMAAMWRQVSNAVEARTALRDILPDLIRTYGQAAASLAADWYDEARTVAGVGGAFTALPADLGDAGADALALWASEHGTDVESIRALTEGGMQRRINNYSRETVMGSALADPAADGWQRVGVGACPFCAMLIGRGAVYSESTADFASHDFCNCAAVPAFKGEPRPVKPYKVSPRREIDPATGKPVIDADFERAQAWIEAHVV